MTKAMAEKIIRLIEIYDELHEQTNRAEQEADRAMDAGEDWKNAEDIWDTCYSFEAAALKNAITCLVLCTKRQIDRPTARKMITEHREELEKILRKAV